LPKVIIAYSTAEEANLAFLALDLIEIRKGFNLRVKFNNQQSGTNTENSKSKRKAERKRKFNHDTSAVEGRDDYMENDTAPSPDKSANCATRIKRDGKDPYSDAKLGGDGGRDRQHQRKRQDRGGGRGAGMGAGGGGGGGGSTGRPKAVQVTPAQTGMPYMSPDDDNKEADDDGKSSAKGIQNLGNTCYLSASLHLLFSIPNFIADLYKKYVEQTSSSSTGGKKMPLTKALLEVAAAIGVLADEDTNKGSFLPPGVAVAGNTKLLSSGGGSTLAVNPAALKKQMDVCTDKFVG